ncbi:hypothetical protein QR680_006988 [Steinernema hermaphroditum]|uniref:Uncharacterized protein n=1 Tax=Steinernema hermaphroditum TaxID=289476 RepID=A0AA39HX82_9BILA|nr:hypothetical protein QR680_006988 [Steinernema hermaphroditum]
MSSTLSFQKRVRFDDEYFPEHVKYQRNLNADIFKLRHSQMELRQAMMEYHCRMRTSSAKPREVAVCSRRVEEPSNGNDSKSLPEGDCGDHGRSRESSPEIITLDDEEEDFVEVLLQRGGDDGNQHQNDLGKLSHQNNQRIRALSPEILTSDDDEDDFEELIPEKGSTDATRRTRELSPEILTSDDEEDDSEKFVIRRTIIGRMRQRHCTRQKKYL